MKIKNEKLRREIIDALKSREYSPSGLRELAALLNVSKSDLGAFKRTLAEMVKSGEIAHVKGGKFCISKDIGLVAGVIRFKQSGAAYIELDSGSEVAVRREDTGVSLNGDRVLARIIDERGGGRRRRDRAFGLHARVIRVTERAKNVVIGTLKRSMNFWHVVADDPKFYYDIIVADPSKCAVEPKPVDGDKVVVSLFDWTQRHINPSGEIVKNLGKSHTPMSEYKAILVKYGLETEFPDAVLSQVETIADSVSQRDIAGRLDLRNEFVITIDPSDAKDFDDALSFKRTADGYLEVGVHIADVTYYVKPSSALDKEALKRGNSTYLVGTVLPMLPFKLSNGLCSLVEDEDRLVKSVFISYDASGDCKGVRFANSVIRSSKRLSYEQAYAFLKEYDLEKIRAMRPPASYMTASSGKPLAELDDEFLLKLRTVLRQMWSLAETLRKKRMRNGALDLEMPEYKIFCDADGYAQKIEKVTYDESHQLVEEFMLAANEAVARELFDAHIPFISRVHDEPDEERLNEYREFLDSFDISCGDLTRRREVMKVLAEIENHPQNYLLKTEFLKSLKRAEYRASCDGHYGLAKHYYAHFTSPIRRYADITVHRCLDFYMKKRGMEGASKRAVGVLGVADLQRIANQVSKTEQNSTSAERESRKVKLLEFFGRKIGTGETFEAIVVSVTGHGFFVELTESMAFGFVHMHALKDDIYRLNSDGNALRGRRTSKVIKVGDKIRVCVESVDLYKRQIDFTLQSTQKNKKKLEMSQAIR